MKRYHLSTAMVLAFVLSCGLALAAGQDSGTKAKQETVTGCLNPSDQAGLLSLSVYEDGKQTKEILVLDNAEVEKHAKNHTVELTGTMVKQDDKDVFRVESVKHVSATCEAPTD